MTQASLFGEEAPRDIALRGAQLRLYPQLLNPQKASRILQELAGQPGWKQDQIHMFGRPVPLPRLHRWFADSGESYRWSGLTMRAEAFPECLLAVRETVSAQTGHSFNTALVNWYRGGQDSVSWHSDNESELGSDPVIASLSLGAERRFLLRRKDNHAEKLSLVLPHGSLLLMSGQTQLLWEHCLPKTQRLIAERVNLTFRKIVRKQA